MAAKQKPILYKGMGQPYLALFNFGGMPIMNPITGIPLGAYISTWSYRYDEEKENLATITFDTGNPDTVDIAEIQENQNICLQWGYIYPDGQFVSGPIKVIKVRDFEATFGNGRLLPAAATQELIFKRVSAYNLSYGDFINSDSLKKTGGIKYD